MKRQIAFHPPLFALYIVLFAYGRNFEFAPPPSQIATLVAIAVGSTVALWVALSFTIRDWRKAGIAASMALLLFASYGHVKNLITPWALTWNIHLYSLTIGEKKLAGIVSASAAAAVAWWVRRAAPKSTALATSVLNSAAFVLAAFSAAEVATVSLAASHRPAEPVVERRTAFAGLGDIYYIILDTYGRSDVLAGVYGYDNRPFIDWLKSKGFYVATESHSNYSQTMLSLASSLNMSYLDATELSSASRANGSGWNSHLSAAAITLRTSLHDNLRLPLAQLIQRNRVAELLKAHGYRFVAFTTGFGGVQFSQADDLRQATLLSDFDESLIATTPIEDLFERFYDHHERHRQRIRYVFDHLADRLDDTAPTFVVAHILCPHAPFAFNADGTAAPVIQMNPNNFYGDDEVDVDDPADLARVVTGYRNQVEYATHQIQHVIDAILSDHTRSHLIVLQGDHGPNLQWQLSGHTLAAAMVNERMSILNAYLVPDDMKTRLYPSITPVNTFRILLAGYLGENEDLLTDRSYFSPYKAPYEFTDVTRALTAVN